MDKGAWWAVVHGIERVGHNSGTKHTHAHTQLCYNKTVFKQTWGGPDLAPRPYIPC